MILTNHCVRIKILRLGNARDGRRAWEGRRGEDGEEAAVRRGKERKHRRSLAHASHSPHHLDARKRGKEGDMAHQCGGLERSFFIPEDGDRGGRAREREVGKREKKNPHTLVSPLSAPLPV